MVEKSWVTEFQEDCLCQEIVQFFTFKNKQGISILLRLCVLDRVVRIFNCVILCLFLKEDVKLKKFHCLFFSCNPWITEEKLPTFTELGKFCTHVFKIIFSTFFQGSINRLKCSQNVAFIQISHFSCTYIELNT